MYVGIDPSISNTGVVVLTPAGELECAINGTFDFKIKRFDTMYYLERYAAQVEFLKSKLSSYDIAAVAYEDYSHDSVHKAYSMGEYNGLLKAALYDIYPKSPIFVAPTRNKLFATGYGNASKEEVVFAALRECPEIKNSTKCSKVTDDVCDAYFLAKIAFYYSDLNIAVLGDSGIPHLRKRISVITSMEDKA